MAIVKEGPTLELMWNIIRGRTEGISKVTFFPQKPDFPEQIPYEQPLPRSTPEKEGVSSSRDRPCLIKGNAACHCQKMLYCQVF